MKIKILSYEFSIMELDGFSSNKNGDNHSENLGTINYDRQEIKVDACHPEKDAVILHELVHAVDKFWYADLKEKQVEKISEGLYHILKENKIDFSKEDIFSEEDEHQRFFGKRVY
jgi:hypothetical protein